MKVWDPIVRVCHWTLAALIVFDWFHDDGGHVHRFAGYVAVVVVLLRLVWAAARRDGDLVPSVSRTVAYVGLLVKGQPSRTLRHNPLGLWMVWLLWLLVLALGVTGFMARLDAFWGNQTVIGLHELFADVLAAAVVVHVAAVCAMSLLWRESLPLAMITGRKRPL